MNARFLVLAVLLSPCAAVAANANAPVLPDPLKTPGDVLTSDPVVICVPGYTQTVRNVPSSLKAQVYREYGILTREPGEYEVDHLISLELGGSNSLQNLWPESYKTQPLNARTKDTLENKLHALACAGTITFTVAQQAIALNWQDAYVKYVGLLPGGVSPAHLPQQPAQPTVHVPTLPPGSVTPTFDLPILPGFVPEPPTAPVPAPDAAPDPTSGPVTPNADGSCPQNAPVKVSKAGVYHLPQGDANYGRTKAVACFMDATSAEAAGYRGVK